MGWGDPYLACPLQEILCERGGIATRLSLVLWLHQPHPPRGEMEAEGSVPTSYGSPLSLPAAGVPGLLSHALGGPQLQKRQLPPAPPPQAQVLLRHLRGEYGPEPKWSCLPRVPPRAAGR